VRVTQAHSDARTREIQEAAFRVFARKGSEGATMQEIAREAEISAGAIYRYYPSKADLIRSVCETKTASVTQVFAEVAAEGRGPLDTLTAIGQKMVESFQDEDFSESVICAMEATLAGARDPEQLGRSMRETPMRINASLEAFVRAAQAAGELSAEIDAHGLALVLHTFVVGLRELYLQTQGEIDVQRAFDAVYQLLRAGAPQPAITTAKGGTGS
jgi:AcrR family transcriptional regulator